MLAQLPGSCSITAAGAAGPVCTRQRRACLALSMPAWHGQAHPRHGCGQSPHPTQLELYTAGGPAAWLSQRQAAGAAAQRRSWRQQAAAPAHLALLACPQSASASSGVSAQRCPRLRSCPLAPEVRAALWAVEPKLTDALGVGAQSAQGGWHRCLPAGGSFGSLGACQHFSPGDVQVLLQDERRHMLVGWSLVGAALGLAQPRASAPAAAPPVCAGTDPGLQAHITQAASMSAPLLAAILGRGTQQAHRTLGDTAIGGEAAARVSPS